MVKEEQLPLLQPMLAVNAEPFDSADYLYEVKWDGYRGLVYLDGETVIRSRNLIDLTEKFPELAGLHLKVNRQPAILDGEIVVFENGKPSFTRLQSRGRMAKAGRIEKAANDRPAVFIAFDVLYTEGRPVIKLPQLERKEILKDMILQGSELILSKHIMKDGIDFFNACAGAGLEGTVAKKADGIYLPGRRSPNWKKFRHTREADLVICGYQTGRSGRGLGSIVLGGKRGGGFVYQGKVGTGFSEREAEALLEAFKKIEVAGPTMGMPGEESKYTRWVQPLLVCSVNYLTTTAEGYLRHPVYRGLRWDKKPGECPALAD